MHAHAESESTQACMEVEQPATEVRFANVAECPKRPKNGVTKVPKNHSKLFSRRTRWCRVVAVVVPPHTTPG